MAEIHAWQKSRGTVWTELQGVTTEQEVKEQKDKWERPLSQTVLNNQ